ncbi:hypothetical protein [Photobacterium damselae]|nr:hypothetical protein [Photobacterium damselae]
MQQIKVMVAVITMLVIASYALSAFINSDDDKPKQSTASALSK